MKRTRLAAGAATTVLAFGLTACAGSVGGAGGSAGSGEGYALGASDEEISAAIADLEPVTLTYQPSAASEKSIQSPSGVFLKEAIEKRSGGKITVDLVWAQAIAPYSEVHEALGDGRVDLAYTLPFYDPAQYGGVNAVGDALADMPSSPFVGEMVTNAVATDVGWQVPEILETYEEKNITPIAPVVASGGYYTICNTPGVEKSDFAGREVRIGSAMQNRLMEHIGASPVSMEYTETFEALQRNTVSCTLSQLVPSLEGGIFEVAPHIGYLTETSISRAPGALLAGSKFSTLPLAYQQIIFDSYADYYHGQMTTSIRGNALAIGDAKEKGGEITELPSSLQQEIADFNADEVAKLADSDEVSADLAALVAESRKKWEAKAAELGFEDSGSTEDFDEWYDLDTDYTPMGDAIYAEVFADRRPS